MQEPHLILVDTFCLSHNIEVSFLQHLSDSGLIELSDVEGQLFVSEDQLSDVEHLVRLRYDLDINIEGIEAITHLLHRVNNMQQEIRSLKNILLIYQP